MSVDLEEYIALDDRFRAMFRADPEGILLSFARYLDDPNLERLRASFEQPIGLLPKDCTEWGVATGDVLWTFTRTETECVFTFGGQQNLRAPVLEYHVRKDFVLVIERRERGEDRSSDIWWLFVYNRARGEWNDPKRFEDRRIMIVRSTSIVFEHVFTHPGAEDPTSWICELDPAKLLHHAPDADKELLTHRVDGFEGGENWLLTWNKLGDGIRFLVVTNDRSERLYVPGIFGQVDVFPRFDRDGAFVNVCVTAESTYEQTRCLRRDGCCVVVARGRHVNVVRRALYVDGHTWLTFKTISDRTWRVEVDGDYKSELSHGVEEISERDGVVLVTYRGQGRHLRAVTPSGTELGVYFDLREDYNAADEWPFVRSQGNTVYFAGPKVNGACQMPVGSQSSLGEATWFNGQYMFACRRKGKRWELSALWARPDNDGNMDCATIRSITATKPFVLSGSLCGAQELYGVAGSRGNYVTARSKRGQIGFDYHEIVSIMEDGTQIVGIARIDRRIVRFRVPC